jgi:hypothetical protein
LWWDRRLWDMVREELLGEEPVGRKRKAVSRITPRTWEHKK